MILLRRDLGLLIPFLATLAQADEQKPILGSSKVYRNDQIPYKGDDQKKSRQFFNGVTHAGFEVEVHETILGPGVQTHAPHQHVHEEIMTILEGTAEAYLDGKTEPAPAGSVIFFASNRLHTVRNAGTIPCRYYVVELRGTTSA
jgi:quercetin dioxygenase-like cupin family protein